MSHLVLMSGDLFAKRDLRCQLKIDYPFQSLDESQVLNVLSTSKEGLGVQEVKRRLKIFGSNTLQDENVSRLRIFLRQFNNLLIYILFAASLVSISIGEFKDFIVINVIIVVNGLLGFWQEMKSESAVSALRKMTETRHKVVRDGVLGWIHSSELVPGDFLLFHEGEVVSADIRLVDSGGLMVDESAITGESTPSTKDHTKILPKDVMPYELSNMLLTGTTIVRGTGQGVVVKTGSQTYFASIAKKLTEESPETPLTKAISFFAKRYVFILILLFLVLGIVGYFQGRSLLDLGYILLASLVSAVPEGLPIVLTFVMVMGAVALSRKQALIRYLPSVETLGSSTVIASDKTGTITEGKLIVREVFSTDSKKLKLIAALCNDATSGMGDPLDVALSSWVEEYDGLRRRFQRKWGYPFDAKLMLMGAAYSMGGYDEVLVKGAYESLKERVQNKDSLKELESVFESYVSQGLRVLAFGYGEWTSNDPGSWKINIVGLIGFLDPPKQGVRESVAAAHRAGIRVIMITGDHPMTAAAVAKEVGIWQDSQSILTGKEIENLADAELLAKIRNTTVFARILPQHKFRLVKLLQACGEIVAVTGDGVNDVPALKLADIGIAMGSGTEAAKSASKMIITDSNINIIVDAIRNARVIADNIRKVIYYLISTSMQEIVLISLAIGLSLPLPLTAIQILWINIVTDGVQDKTFPFAKGEGNVMLRKPRSPSEQFFDRKQILRILSFGLGMGSLSYFLYVNLLNHYDHSVVSTIIFTSVVMAQWANGIQSQKESEPFFKDIKKSFSINPYIYLAVCLGLILQLSAIYLMPNVFDMSPITLEQWIYPIVVFVVAFMLVECRKWIEQLQYRNPRSS